MPRERHEPSLPDIAIKEISALDGLRETVLGNAVTRLSVDPGLPRDGLKRAVQESLGPGIRQGFAHFENMRTEEDLWLEVLNALGYARKPPLSCKESAALLLAGGAACLIATGLDANPCRDGFLRRLREPGQRLSLLLFAYRSGDSPERRLVGYDRASLRDHIALAREAGAELLAGSRGEATSFIDAHYQELLNEIGLSIMHGDFTGAGELALALAPYWQSTGQASDRYVTLRECLYACSSIDPTRYAEIACHVGRAAFEAGDYAVMLEAVHRAEGRLSAAVDPRVAARLKGVHLAALDACGRFDEAIGAARELARLAESLPTAEARVIALVNASAALGNAGCIDEALELLAGAEDAARDRGAMDHRDVIVRNVINLLIQDERYADALERIREFDDRVPTTREGSYATREHEVSLSLARGYIQTRDGNPAEGRPSFEAALTLALDDAVPRPYRFLAMMGIAECAIGSGLYLEALGSLLPVFDEAIAQGHWRHLARALELAALALRGLSDPSSSGWRREAMLLARGLRARTGQRRSPWEERQWASLAEPEGLGLRPQAEQTEGLLVTLAACRRLRNALSRFVGLSPR